MNQNTTMVIIIIIMVAITIKNALQLKDVKKDRKFIDVYTMVLNGDEEALDRLNSFINENTSKTHTNKALILKAYEELKHNIDPKETVESIDFHCLFINEKTNNYDSAIKNKNLDIFIWLAIALARFKKDNRKDLIDSIKNKLSNEDAVLTNCLEYHLYKGYLAAIEDRCDEDEKFLQDLIDGEYTGLSYDKKLIGLYKRIAAAYLAYEGKQLDEYYEEDMKDFASKLVGRILLDDLNILDKYEIKEEIEDSIQEEKE